ncbi:hypothetical protein GGP41_010204 [Bipolaris sorokiniana]|uniref:Uncharacterized protein n=1 Tax=Cochliobolus sativus TaxID=45130 RepID=A0A8H5ZHJ2_COCSA|nr:hypothetical protein GGP41_010204 [Bipolaris sorokiniana]
MASCSECVGWVTDDDEITWRHALRSLYRSKSWSDKRFWLTAYCGCAVCGSDSVKILVRLGCARGLRC